MCCATTGRAISSAAEQLYAWLIKPFEAVLAEHPIDTLVFVPDGVLRLIPIDALYDGRQFVLEKYATGTVIGMSMTNSSLPGKRRIESLVAGMSEPGPVVTKLDDDTRQADHRAPPRRAGRCEYAGRRIGRVRSPRARLAGGSPVASENAAAAQRDVAQGARVAERQG